jgi:superfamily II DNA or RNA helicase
MEDQNKKYIGEHIGEHIEGHIGGHIEHTEPEEEEEETEQHVIFPNMDACRENYHSKKCNRFLLKKELQDGKELSKHPAANSYLYPSLDDPKFNLKISQKEEFYDTQYDGEIHEDIKERAEEVINNASFELQPHQAFVKNYMSLQTPYNSLLLYHGLGTGKTYSAIGVCEEMRRYLKMNGGEFPKIMIIASKNIQDNFRNQLFDETKLTEVNGVWTLPTGAYLLNEINPANIKGLTREQLTKQMNNLIDSYYIFMGYIEFANYIHNIHKTAKDDKKKKQLLKNEFAHRLIVIDEIHNIRMVEDNVNKKVAENLELLVKNVQFMKLVFLSATPMYNNYREIIWLLNIMNMNDRRAKIEVKDIFDKQGQFKEGGKELLIRKATGYVSFVRGENPYTFPYRVYPNIFAKDRTFPHIPYPEYQMNEKKIKKENQERILSLYLTVFPQCGTCGNCQACAYRYIIAYLRKNNFSYSMKDGTVRQMPLFQDMESFGYNVLQKPLESLIISYPVDGLKEILDRLPVEQKGGLEEDDDANGDGEGDADEDDEYSKSQDPSMTIPLSYLTGKQGLARMMTWTDTKTPGQKGNYEYKPKTLEKYGRIFAHKNIGQYSAKIKAVLDNIVHPTSGKVSEGVILIYSQYLDSGLIPMALALEELGFSRFGTTAKSLFRSRPVAAVDVRTMKPRTDASPTAQYAMITGDIRLSPETEAEVKRLTKEDNKDGHKIKVVLISKAGAEGIDFKFIRQIHILEPWYNMSSMEQIIGRGVRNLSHKDLPFEKRNVEIFMHGTILQDPQEESADLYVYRASEYKAKQIGKITRILKETSVDCIINHDQTNFTQAKMGKTITQELSNGTVLRDFKVGDVPYSAACDYMEKCDFDCVPHSHEPLDKIDINRDTYNENFLLVNSEKIIQRVRMLMKEGFFYKKATFLQAIRTPKEYPYVQIYAALTHLIDNENEFITDKYGRMGRLVNVGDYYLFQPVELLDKNASIFDRSVPVDYKHTMATFHLKKEKDILQDPEPDPDVQDKTSSEQSAVVEEAKAHYETTLTFMKQSLGEGEKNWYMYCGKVAQLLSQHYPDMKDRILAFVVHHIIEMMPFEEKLGMMNYLYDAKTSHETNSFEEYAKEYFIQHSLSTEAGTCFVMYKGNQYKLYLLNKNHPTKWIEADSEQVREIGRSPEFKQKMEWNKENYNMVVGFIGYDKTKNTLVYKTKNILLKTGAGAKCEEEGKPKTVKKLKELLQHYGDGKTEWMEHLNHVELCVVQELFLRYFQSIMKDNKQWFVSPEMAMYFKFYPI